MDARLTRLLAAVAGLALLGLIAAGSLVAYHRWTERYVVSTGPNDDVAVSQVVRAAFSGASALKVGELTGTVQGVASADRGFGLFSATRVMKAPFSVEYFVDLSRMGPTDYRWNSTTRTLTVHPPDVRVGAPAIDEAHLTLDETRGLFVTRGAMAEMQRTASARAQAVAGEEARKPQHLAAARERARADLARLLAGPLAAAGVRGVTVAVEFPGEGDRPATPRWDMTRPIPDVLGRAR